MREGDINKWGKGLLWTEEPSERKGRKAPDMRSGGRVCSEREEHVKGPEESSTA